MTTTKRRTLVKNVWFHPHFNMNELSLAPSKWKQNHHGMLFLLFTNYNSDRIFGILLLPWINEWNNLSDKLFSRCNFTLKTAVTAWTVAPLSSWAPKELYFSFSFGQLKKRASKIWKEYANLRSNFPTRFKMRKQTQIHLHNAHANYCYLSEKPERSCER